METITCSCCKRPRKFDDYYSSSSYFNRGTGKVNVCKLCIWDYVIPKNDGDYDFDKVKRTLRMMDKPFIEELWVSSIEESESRKSNSPVFKMYMKNIAMKDFRDLTWEDGITESNAVDEDDSEDIYELEEFHLSNDIIHYWGSGYSKKEYEFLEFEKTKLTASFECPDYGMEMIMKDICFINLEIDKIRQERKDNSQKTLTNLIETRGKLMNDANMKPIQSTGADGNDQITFGTLIRKWENERPVPKPLDDEMKEYIDTYMVGHLAKMEGLTNDMTRKYDKVIAEYTINHSEIKKDNSDWDD